MVIAIDLTSLSYHLTGIERYAANVSNKMIEQDVSNYYILIFRNEIYPLFKNKIDRKRVTAKILQGNHKLIFYQIVLPYHLYKIKADRYLFFAFNSPIIFKKKGIYNTIHDMGAWDSPGAMKKLQRLYWRVTIRVAAKFSEGIITVSEFSKRRISELLKYPKEKIYLVYSAVSEEITKTYNLNYNVIKNKYHLPDKYIMTLSTLEPRKNITVLLKAFSKVADKVDYDLVLVGRKGWMMDTVLEQHDVQKRIHITGFVKDEHISLIYKNALCFIFPSLYEGFGLPPVEALALGIPVIASDAASIPEILHKQAMYFKNNSVSELENILIGLEKHLNMMPHGLNEYQRKEYNFERSANKVLRLIEADN